MNLNDYIRDIPDFPKEGIIFKDISPLLGDAAALRASIDQLAEKLAGPRRALVAGVGVDDAPSVIDDVGHKVLTAHGNDSSRRELQRVETALDGHRGNDLGQLDAMSPLGPGDQAFEERSYLVSEAVEK